MNWPYHILELSPKQKVDRRMLLDQYALYAQFSTFIPLGFFMMLRLMRTIIVSATKKRTSSNDSRLSYSADYPGGTMLNQLVWWLWGDVQIAGYYLGRKSQFLLGSLWIIWFFFLSINETGNDYFHLTKRFGIVGTSQLPILYLLSLKRLNPVAYAFHMSHETVNQWHRILGRIVCLLVTLHGGLYISFYIRSSSFGSALFRAVPVLGILALTGITVLNTAAISVIRKYSYRIFFFTHIVVAFALPPIIWFHVPYSRAFVAESFVVLVLDLFLRSFGTVQSLATVEKVPGTDLVKIVAKVPSKYWAHFAKHPASHAYLSIPARSGTIQEPLLSPFLRYGFLLNPFTVASVREGTRKLTFVMRVKNGPLTKSFDRLTSQDEHTGSTKTIVSIDGPYGATSKFSILESSSFDYVLLVAGGVGATFIMPLYEKLIANNVSAEVKVVWAVKHANETSWPRLSTQESIYNDPRVDLYTTGANPDRDANDSGSESHVEDVEMNIWKDGRCVPVGDRQRPDFQKIVDQIFVKNYYKRIAVVVCGPVSMSQDLRRAVEVWVKKSKDIWFHSESFGL